MRWTLLGASLLLASGLAWAAAAVSIPLWSEVALCLSIAAGYALVLAAVVRDGDAARPIAGFAVAALATLAPFAVYGAPRVVTLGVLGALVPAAGFAVAAAGALRGSAPMARAGVAVAALGGVLLVAAADGDGLSIWTPGNVLLPLGAAVLAFGWRGEP